jgi:hypothetical protein
MLLAARSPSSALIASLTLVAPIFLSLTLHRRRRRVCDLEPLIRATGPVWRAKPFRHNALAAELASVLVDDSSVAHDGEALDGRGDHWKARREIVSVACEKPHAARVLPGEDAEAVMLNLVYPAGSGRRFPCRSGQARRHRAGLEAARVGWRALNKTQR